jgi:hypothetical protein
MNENPRCNLFACPPLPIILIPMDGSAICSP